MNHNTIHIQKDNLVFEFLETGDVYQIKNENILINQLKGNYLDGSLMNIYLRIKKNDTYQFTPLLGIKSNSSFSYNEDSVTYHGCFEHITYQVQFLLSNNNYWFYKINLNGIGEVDLIYAQDIGIASKGAVTTNEAYVSQYIDHSIQKNDIYGYYITSRQNQPEGGLCPAIQHGCLSGSEHYSTDGFQFFGISYKETNIPEILQKDYLQDYNYQYELAYPALQTKKIILNKEKEEEIIFYGYYQNHLDVESNKEEFLKNAVTVYHNLSPSATKKTEVKQVKQKPFTYLSGNIITKEETRKRYGTKLIPEMKEECELSFFTEDYEHIVTKTKELLVERPHGCIIQTGHSSLKNEETIATTFFMNGIFNSQIVLGNTTFHKLFSNIRNHLNIFKNSGQRIWIDNGTNLQLLTIPSLFEMGINYGKWIYELDNDTIEILNYTTLESPEIHLCVTSKKNINYKFYVTSHVIMGENEFGEDGEVSVNENEILIKPNKNMIATKVHPEMFYKMKILNTNFDITDDRIFYTDNNKKDSKLMVIAIENSNFEIVISGNLYGSHTTLSQKNFVEEKVKYNNFFKEFSNNFKLKFEDQQKNEILNITIWWYLHNAFIHYVSPHGVEQYGGAAWGTRDVCQGPFELMIAFEKYDEAKEILTKVYSHQFDNSGNWPQWFMFDKYENIQADESHGDIIVWPLKALSDYLLVTRDFAFLEKEIPYCNFKEMKTTLETETLLQHVKKQLQYIFDHTMFDTALSNYGNGDWDDTLQPHNASLKSSMVSSWTVALTYQTIKQFASLIDSIEPAFAKKLTDFYEKIEVDFKKYLMKDNVVSGLAIMKSMDDIKYLIHPSDKNTGITYRLLPMTRSIIAELFSKEEANHHIDIMTQHLKFQDGIRLVNHPVKYLGGKTVYFKRGEQAANFGREIGILYVHSNIRYSEAMAKIGNGKEAWESLYKITPVGLSEVVQNATYRQSNLYFSSSDACFNTRYEAYDNFGQLKNGNIPVKGGWRLYSSGPGIYIRQLISNCLGIRKIGNTLVIDPVLPDSSNLDFEFKLNDYSVLYKFINNGNQKVNAVNVNGINIKINPISNTYRNSGVLVNLSDLYNNFSKNTMNIIEIHL